MKREIRTTADGSSTVYVADIDQTYHSMHGALQESRHVYVDAGLHHYCQAHPDAKEVKVFEMGFGTGLNALLTHNYATANGLAIYYETVDLYPLTTEEAGALNHQKPEVNESAIL